VSLDDPTPRDPATPADRSGGASEDAGPPARSDRHPLNWLLVLPLIATLYPPLYNRTTPELAGIPFFYWYQLATIAIGVTCTYVVYRATKQR